MDAAQVPAALKADAEGRSTAGATGGEAEAADDRFSAPEAAFENGRGVGLSSTRTPGAAVPATAGESAEQAPPVARQQTPERNGAAAVAKPLYRVREAWVQDAASDQLGCEEGSFVEIWPQTKTEHGWVYASRVKDSAGGWIPTTILEEPAAGRRWATAVRAWQSEDPGQVVMVEGGLYSIYLDSRTDLGWVFVEVEDGARGSCAPKAPASAEAGWVPDYCFEWPDEA